MKAAQAVVECLKKENITTVFGYPGAAICPVYEALAASDIEHILVRNEQSAGHAASGYARISGRPAVCIATSGPGAANLLTAIATAYMDSIPVIFITGQVCSDLIGRDVFQEADVTGASEPFIKHSFLIKNASRLPEIFKEAFLIAGTGRKGPVLIDIPEDIQEQDINFSYPENLSIRSYKPTTKGNKLQLRRCAEAIGASSRPLICAGGGVILSDAKSAVRSLVERTGIPIVTTMMGLGTLPTAHPLNYGMIGRCGSDKANLAMKKCDLLILIGARVGDRAIQSPEFIESTTKIIHIDIDPAEIGKNIRADIPVVGDAKIVAEQLAPLCPENVGKDWLGFSPSPSVSHTGLDPHEIIAEASRLSPDGSICVCDVGQHLCWAASSFILKENSRFLTSGGMGTMGYSLPAAEGACLASERKSIITVCGDGAFQMSMAELATIKRHNLPVKIIIMDNSCLGMVREHQLKSGLSPFAVSLDGSPDYIKLAEAYGIDGETLSQREDLHNAVKRLVDAKGPYILLCKISPDEKSF